MNTLTTLSPIVPERLGELKSRLRVVRYVPGLGRPLLELGFIHYARWAIIDGLPQPGGGGWRGLRSKYLLLQSIFDGERTDYLDAFADVLPARLAKLWGACVGFEASVERVRGAQGRIVAPYAFRAFVERNSLDLVAQYDAYTYPAASVRQAIGMHQRIVAAEDDYGGQEVLLDRMPKVGSMALGPAPGPLTAKERLRGVGRPWLRAVCGRYGVNPLTVVLPLSDPSTEAKALPPAWMDKDDTPLNCLAGTDTHFARFTFIAPDIKDLGQPSPDWLGRPYFLYTSNFRGDAYSHIERLFERQGQMEDIWEQCCGFAECRADRESFHAWLGNHTVPIRYYVAGYPPESVADIDRYVAKRNKVEEAYGSQQPPRAATLIEAWDTAEQGLNQPDPDQPDDAEEPDA